MTGLLEIRDLSVAFRRRAGFRRGTIACVADVTLTARPGELLALVGASGAGKSLLAHAVLGLLPPNAVLCGEIRLDGSVLDAAAKARLRGRRLALVPQSLSHLDPLAPTGRQLAWAARRGGDVRRSQDVARMLRAVGLSPDVAALSPTALSGGMARLVLLAAALANDADVVIADEPTNGLDPANAALVLRRLRALADDGRTVIAITHDLAAALPFAHRVCVMQEGRIVATERAADFANDGSRLEHGASRALWRALPQNDFLGAAGGHA